MFHHPKPQSSPKNSNSSSTSQESNKCLKYNYSKKMKAGSSSKLEIMKIVNTQNFRNLSESKLNDCWQEMARQIKSFKRKLRKVSEWCEAEESRITNSKPNFETAHRIISANTTYAPKDHKDLFYNLIKGIDQGKIIKNSLAFDRICTLVRTKLPSQSLQNVKSTNEFSLKVNVDGQKVPITDQEYNLLKDFNKESSLSYQSKSTAIISILFGSNKIKFNCLPIIDSKFILPLPDFYKPTVQIEGAKKEILIPSINSLCKAIRSEF